MMHILNKQVQKRETTRSWESKPSHTGALQTHLNIFPFSWHPCLGSGPHGQLIRSLEGKKTKEKGGELERRKAGFFSRRKGECLVPACNGRSGTCKSQAAAPPVPPSLQPIWPKATKGINIQSPGYWFWVICMHFILCCKYSIKAVG